MAVVRQSGRWELRTAAGTDSLQLVIMKSSALSFVAESFPTLADFRQSPLLCSLLPLTWNAAGFKVGPPIVEET